MLENYDILINMLGQKNLNKILYVVCWLESDNYKYLACV